MIINSHSDVNAITIVWYITYIRISVIYKKIPLFRKTTEIIIIIIIIKIMKEDVGTSKPKKHVNKVRIVILYYMYFL